MKPTSLYVQNVPYTVSARALIDAFGAHGRVKRASIPLDRQTARPRGIAFVEMMTNADADAALLAMNGAQIGGRVIVVSFAKARREH